MYFSMYGQLRDPEEETVVSYLNLLYQINIAPRLENNNQPMKISDF